MKTKEYIKMGIGVYIGWTIAETIDKALGKCEFTNKIRDRIDKFNKRLRDRINRN